MILRQKRSGRRCLERTSVEWHKEIKRQGRKERTPCSSWTRQKYNKRIQTRTYSLMQRLLWISAPPKDDPHCIRITAGGNFIKYKGGVSTWTADLTKLKLLWNSVLSTRSAKYMCLDVKIFFSPQHSSISSTWKCHRRSSSIWLNNNTILMYTHTTDKSSYAWSVQFGASRKQGYWLINSSESGLPPTDTMSAWTLPAYGNMNGDP